MTWDTQDYIVALILLSCTAAGLYIVRKYPKSRHTRTLGTAVILLVFVLVWSELAVGVLP